MDSVYFHDKGALGIGEEYRKVYGLPSGTNLIRHQVSNSFSSLILLLSLDVKLARSLAAA